MCILCLSLGLLALNTWIYLLNSAATDISTSLNGWLPLTLGWSIYLIHLWILFQCSLYLIMLILLFLVDYWPVRGWRDVQPGWFSSPWKYNPKDIGTENQISDSAAGIWRRSVSKQLSLEISVNSRKADRPVRLQFCFLATVWYTNLFSLNFQDILHLKDRIYS